jgi:hypothetical protein
MDGAASGLLAWLSADWETCSLSRMHGETGQVLHPLYAVRAVVTIKYSVGLMLKTALRTTIKAYLPSVVTTGRYVIGTCAFLHII